MAWLCFAFIQWIYFPGHGGFERRSTNGHQHLCLCRVTNYNEAQGVSIESKGVPSPIRFVVVIGGNYGSVVVVCLFIHFQKSEIPTANDGWLVWRDIKHRVCVFAFGSHESTCDQQINIIRDFCLVTRN